MLANGNVPRQMMSALSRAMTKLTCSCAHRSGSHVERMNDCQN